MHKSLLYPYLTIIKWIFFIQIVFIALHITFSFVLAPLSLILSRRKEAKLKLYREKVVKEIQEKKAWAADWIPLPFQTISFLIPLILQINQEIQDPYWEEIKKNIFQTILFPKAKKCTYAKDWKKRIEAVSCYLHFSDIENEEEILHLLQDSIPAAKKKKLWIYGKS